MHDQRDQPQGDAGKNPTVDAPGSQVADYGNPTGGSADLDELERKHGMNSDRQGNSSVPADAEETTGNP